MDLITVLRNLRNAGDLSRVVTNPRAQFGRPGRAYLGATLLPERTVQENAYREETIRYRSVIANDGTRYSPPQKKGGSLVGSFEVFLAESDMASEMTGQEYDALLSYLRRNASMEAVASLVRWIDTTINIPLIEKNELHRWEAIVDASVKLRGDNGYSEDVAYSNPAGHRAAAGGTWSSNSYDPLADIVAMVQLLTDKGFQSFRFITSRKVSSKLALNAKMAARMNRAVINSSGSIVGASGRLTIEDLNTMFAGDGMPPIELYDLQYRTQTGSARFMADTVFVIVANTGRDEELDLGDVQSEILPDTLGYTAIGRPAGQANPGRVLVTEAKDNKPPRIEAQGWQTSLPVITEPEAIAVITGIS